MVSRELVGHVDVDAGLVWVGDPCYVLGDDATHRVTDWSDFCDRMHSTGHNENSTSQPLGAGVGVAVESGYGDGSYPVWIERDRDGSVRRLTVEFITEVEDD